MLVLKSFSKLKEIDFGISPKLKVLRLEELPKLSIIICKDGENASKGCLLSPSTFKNFRNLKELLIVALPNEKVSFFFSLYYFIEMLAVVAYHYFKIIIKLRSLSL